MKIGSDGRNLYDIARYLSASSMSYICRNFLTLIFLYLSASSMSYTGILASKNCAFEALYNAAESKLRLNRNRLLSFDQMSFIFLD